MDIAYKGISQILSVVYNAYYLYYKKGNLKGFFIFKYTYDRSAVFVYMKTFKSIFVHKEDIRRNAKITFIYIP